MNIRGLLLGSAALLAAGQVARAADAVEVVAEPEPMEYVRVCDTYGTGYFYIPGTETCLRIGGYVRYDIGMGDALDGYGGVNTFDHLDGDAQDSWNKLARFNLHTFTGTETELGSLKTFTETRFDFANGGGTEVSLAFAWIELGGFRIGRDESQFAQFTGYAGGVLADDLIPYAPLDTNLITYTFDAGNGFSAVISLEEGTAADLSYDGHDYTLDSYVPHVVAGVKYAGDWGGVSVVGGYDSIHEEYAAKGRLDITVNDSFSLFVMGGWGSSDNEETVFTPEDLDGDGVVAPGEGTTTISPFNYYKPWGGDWALWGGASYTINDKATLNGQLSYDDSKQFGVALNVDWQPVPDLHIIPEALYKDYGDNPGYEDDGQEQFAGVLRIQRDF